MTSEEFVRVVEIQVSESSTSTMRALLERPPGRRPDSASLERAIWFNALSDRDKAHITEIIELSVDVSVFTFLDLLDGTKTINPYPGRLALIYVDGGTEKLLNDGPAFLYEIYRRSEQRDAGR